MTENYSSIKQICNKNNVSFQRAYADKMISEADTQIDQDVLKKLISLLNTKGDSQSDALIIIWRLEISFMTISNTNALFLFVDMLSQLASTKIASKLTSPKKCIFRHFEIKIWKRVYSFFIIIYTYNVYRYIRLNDCRRPVTRLKYY